MNEQITESLIALGVKGDSDAMGALYREFSPKMYGVCLRYMKNEADAEDVLHDAFVKIFSRLRQFRGDGNFEGWIRRIVVNTAISHLGRGKRLLGKIDEPDCTTADTTETILEKIGYKQIIEILAQMPIGYRTIFNLYAIEGYSHKEIGKILKINEATSRSQYMRARQMLAEKVKE